MVRPFEPHEWPTYRDVRLRSLADVILVGLMLDLESSGLYFNAFRTAGLQGRVAVEIDALLGVVVELAEMVDLPAPTCRTVLALVRGRARTAGCY